MSFFFSSYLYWLSSFYLWKQHCIDSICTKSCKKKVLIYPVTQCYRYSGNILNCLKNVPFYPFSYLHVLYYSDFRWILNSQVTFQWFVIHFMEMPWKKWIANFFLMISPQILFIWELTWVLGKYNAMVSCCILQFWIHKIVLLE